MSLRVDAVRTRVFHEGESLAAFAIEVVPRELVREKMVLAVTSKIVSLAENRVVRGADKAKLVREEADQFLGEIGYGCSLTIKHGLFIASAGIDESNVEGGGLILFPEDPFSSARKLWAALRAGWGIKDLGIILTDSQTTPLRRGVTGISLAHWGFQGVRSLVGTPDLFGRELKMTSMAMADGLAASAVMMMGEGRESTPLAVLTGVDLVFTETTDQREVSIPLEEDLYYPLFREFTK